jgi:excisionase family DNA binding protein
MLIGIPETAAVLGIGRTRTYELCNSGQIRTVRIGGRRLVPVVELERFVAELHRAAGIISPVEGPDAVTGVLHGDPKPTASIERDS